MTEIDKEDLTAQFFCDIINEIFVLLLKIKIEYKNRK